MWKERQNKIDYRCSIVDRIIKDVAISSRISKQSIVLNHYLCPYWYQIEKEMYEQNLSIGATLSQIWMNTWVMDKVDMIEIVKFAEAKTRDCKVLPDSSIEEWYHLCSLLESMNNYLSTKLKYSFDSTVFDNHILLSDVIEAYERKDVIVGFFFVYKIIIEEWELFRDKIKIYNLLQSMAMVQRGWKNSPQDRIELMRLLFNAQPM